MGQLMELRVTGPAPLLREGTHSQKGLEWRGKGVGSGQDPCLGHLTLPLVATFEWRVTAPSDLS